MLLVLSWSAVLLGETFRFGAWPCQATHLEVDRIESAVKRSCRARQARLWRELQLRGLHWGALRWGKSSSAGAAPTGPGPPDATARKLRPPAAAAV